MNTLITRTALCSYQSLFHYTRQEKKMVVKRKQKIKAKERSNMGKLSTTYRYYMIKQSQKFKDQCKKFVNTISIQVRQRSFPFEFESLTSKPLQHSR